MSELAVSCITVNEHGVVCLFCGWDGSLVGEVWGAAAVGAEPSTVTSPRTSTRVVGVTTTAPTASVKVRPFRRWWYGT